MTIVSATFSIYIYIYEIYCKNDMNFRDIFSVQYS